MVEKEIDKREVCSLVHPPLSVISVRECGALRASLWAHFMKYIIWSEQSQIY